MILPATSSMTIVQKLAIKTTITALTTSLRISFYSPLRLRRDPKGSIYFKGHF
jgi:hypothetical protein